MSTKRPKRGGLLRRLRPARPPAAELADLRGSFLAWLAGHELPVHIDLAELWDDAVTVVDLAAERAGLTDLGSWTADRIGVVAAAAAERDDPELLTAVPLLLAFLAETGRWRGTGEQLGAALQAAEAASSPLREVLDALASVEVDPTVEDAAVRALPVIARAEALLRFLSRRRPLTTTGALRRADVVTAAGLVGVDLAGRTPRSMWDVHRLAVLWEVLEATWLLEIVADHAQPTPHAGAWLHGDTERGRQAREHVVDGHLDRLLDDAAALPGLPDPRATVLPALAAAAIGSPMPTALALGVPDAVGGAAGVPDDLPAAAVPVHRVFSQLADDGILAVSDTVDCPPGLRGVLARFTSVLLQRELGAG